MIPHSLYDISSCNPCVQAIEEGGLEEYEEMRRRKAGKPLTDFDSQPGTPNPEKRKKSRANVALEKGAPNPPEVTKQLKKLLHTVLQHEDRLDSALLCRCHTIFHCINIESALHFDPHRSTTTP